MGGNRNKKYIYSLLFTLVLCLTACKNNTKNVPKPDKKTYDSEELIGANRVLVRKDRQRILGYINRKSWDMKETSTGLWYEILENGTGDTIRPGQIITFEYKVRLLDETVCYSSDDEGVKSFQVGRGGVEPGLEQAVLLCQKGSKARFIMPPYLAHGLPGDGNCIPARAIIVYDIKIKGVKNKK